MDMREGMCNKCRYFIKVDASQEYCRCPHCGQLLNVREALERYRQAALQPYLSEESCSVKISFCGGADKPARK